MRILLPGRSRRRAGGAQTGYRPRRYAWTSQKGSAGSLDAGAVRSEPARRAAPSARAASEARRARADGLRSRRRSTSRRRARARARRFAPRGPRSRLRLARAPLPGHGSFESRPGSSFRPGGLRSGAEGTGWLFGGPGIHALGRLGLAAHEIGPAPVVITHGAVLDRRGFAWRRRRAARGRARRAGRCRERPRAPPSSASRLSRSERFVGSSRTRKFAPDATMQASSRRRCSPPESAEIGFSWASQPEKRNCPSSAWACGRCSPVTACVNERTLDSPRSVPTEPAIGPSPASAVETVVLGEVAELDAVSETGSPARRRPALENRVDERRLAASVRPDETDVVPALERGA